MRYTPGSRDIRKPEFIVHGLRGREHRSPRTVRAAAGQRCSRRVRCPSPIYISAEKTRGRRAPSTDGETARAVRPRWPRFSARRARPRVEMMGSWWWVRGTGYVFNRYWSVPFPPESFSHEAFLFIVVRAQLDDKTIVRGISWPYIFTQCAWSGTSIGVT